MSHAGYVPHKRGLEAVGSFLHLRELHLSPSPWLNVRLHPLSTWGCFTKVSGSRARATVCRCHGGCGFLFFVVSNTAGGLAAAVNQQTAREDSEKGDAGFLIIHCGDSVVNTRTECRLDFYDFQKHHGGGAGLRPLTVHSCRRPLTFARLPF